jgi:hypothetical protein
MTSIVTVSVRVGAHCALMLGGLLTAAACGGGEPTAPPDVGSGAGHAAGGMSQGGTSGSVIPEGGQPSGTGGMLPAADAAPAGWGQRVEQQRQAERPLVVARVSWAGDQARQGPVPAE